MKSRKWLKPFPILRIVLSLLVAGQAFPARELLAAPASSSVSVKLITPYAGNPGAIAVVNAVPDFSIPKKGGGVELSWSAPAAPDGSSVFSYVIKYSTFPANGLGYEAWWNNPNTLTAIENGLPSEWGRLAHAAPGDTESTYITGLVPAVYYYFGVRARDRYFRLADYDGGLKSITDQAKTYAATLPWTPTKITSIAAEPSAQIGAVALSWTIPEFMNQSYEQVPGKIYYPGEYCVQYSTIPPVSVNRPNEVNNWEGSTRVFMSTSNVKTSDRQYMTISGLMNPSAYYFLVFVRNEWPNHWSGMPTQTASARPFNDLKPVTGLGASSDASADMNIGSFINLSWSNPQGENNMRGVRICYSTTTVPNIPDTAQYIDLQPETSGQARLYKHIQLIPRTTYYYTAFTFEGNGFYSVGTSTQCYIEKDLIAPDPVSNITANASNDASYNEEDRFFITLKWSTPEPVPAYRNSDFTGVKIYSSTYTQIPSQQTYIVNIDGINSETTTFPHDDLNPYTTYYYSIFSFDYAGNVSTTPAKTQCYVSESLITPSKPKVISMFSDANRDPTLGCGIYMRWSTPAEKTVTGTRVIFRNDRFPANPLDGSVWVDKPAQPNAIYDLSVTQLTPNTTYYVAFLAYTSRGVYSKMASIPIFISLPWSDNQAPSCPLGLKISKIPQSQVELEWASVQYNSDRTKFGAPERPSIMDLYKYEIYRSTGLFGNWQQISEVGYDATSFLDTLPGSDQYFYKVRAIDASGNFGDSYIIDVDGQVHITCEDGSSLALAQSKVKNNVILALTRETSDEKGPIVKSIEWEPYNVVEGSVSYSLAKVNNFTSYDTISSTTANSGISISYVTGLQNPVKTAPALRAMTEAEIERNVSVFYYNGLEWLKLQSTMDKENKVIKAKAKFAGRYQLRKSPQATEFTFFNVMPKIITPNNDGQNDRALFRYSNPKASSISIKIFDLKGALVNKLNETNVTSDIHGDYVYWDGADDSGKTVPVGVYIYQLEGEGKVINGTIVVAR